jgi:LysR family transcriptional activator of nhaA
MLQQLNLCEKQFDKIYIMEWLNYHHFLYFYVVAREGGLAPAARVLGLSHPTISKQIHQLEDALGTTLLERRGRSLELTAAGHRAYSYAHEIFSLGQEFLRAEKHGGGMRRRLAVGVTAAMPKLITRELLAPALDVDEPPRLNVVEDDHERLLARLALHELDLVLADSPVPPNSPIRAFNHRLGDCGLSFFATKALARRLKGRFPAVLHGAPLLVPTTTSAVRRVLEPWLRSQELEPEIVAEMDDLSLIKAFGQAGRGVFFAPALVEADVVATYSVKLLGRVDEVRESFYAITTKRRLDNPLVMRVCDSAKSQLARL